MSSQRPQIRRARGARVDGLIDFTSGWLVANIGHDNRRVRRAVRKARGWAVMDGFENPLRTQAEAAMFSILPPHLDRIAFYNSGSEAMDAAMRFPGGVVAHPRAFHGSTIATQGIDRRESWPRIPLYMNVVVETFLGPWCEWHTQEQINEMRREQASGQFLIFDEMQAGFGRTGKWWGFEHYDIEPDIVVGGKAMAGGFPMGFVAGRAELMEKNRESTFSGNALACAACVATIKEIRRRKLVERAEELGEIIKFYFPDAQGKGLAYAFDHPDADKIVDYAYMRGLILLRTGRGTIKICPPLVISERDLIHGLDILQAVV